MVPLWLLRFAGSFPLPLPSPSGRSSPSVPRCNGVDASVSVAAAVSDGSELLQRFASVVGDRSAAPEGGLEQRDRQKLRDLPKKALTLVCARLCEALANQPQQSLLFGLYLALSQRFLATSKGYRRSASTVSVNLFDLCPNPKRVRAAGQRA